MKRLHHLYAYALIVLVPILLLLYLGSVEADVYAASPRQQPAFLTVGVSPPGNGTVDQDPADPYTHGDVVTLTVTADLGWTFFEWSGDLTGSQNPITLTMDSDKTVTATLTPEVYTLTVGVSPSGNGSVDKDPDQATYLYGEVVTLTVTPDLGWTFSEWSGDLTGSDNPITLTMDSEKTVTATLIQEVYTLTVGVSPSGSGSVDKEPDQETYLYGDVVTLTVTAYPGWKFFEWSGDLTGNQNPVTLTMDSEKTVTATLQNLSDINIWYGSHQVFGHIGIPQDWVNILGNVSDPDGVVSLTYSLNGGPELPLSIGPDTRRLESEGDFNVDIAYAGLNPGLNQVVITAIDELDNTAVETVTVEYVSGNVWPETYSIDWSSVADIPDVAQIVDGLWTLEADSIRPAILGYDREIAIGDVTWDDYEVTVPITIYDIDESGYDPPSSGPMVGILMRWTGHTDDPVSGWQPKSGYLPLGAIGMYHWKNDALGDRLQITGNEDTVVAEDTSGRKLEYGVPYVFRMHVETITGPLGLYSFKVWEEGQPEPPVWDLVAQEGLWDPQNGSLLLIAHHVDASFGDVTITPGPFADTIQPIISNIQVTVGETWATVTWDTNEPATSSVAYGPTVAYGDSVEDTALVTEHSITLTDLFQGALYHYQITSADASGNPATSTDLTFRTEGVASSIVSDDFNTCELNLGLWEFVNPLADGADEMMGTFTEDAWLSISVPAGTDHDIWTENRAPRIMQPANDVDFEIEVKFESEMSEEYQMQGVLIEQDSSNFLRFDFHSDGFDTYIFATSFVGGTPTTPMIYSPITSVGVAPLYMRVRRTGDLWTLSYSYDGGNWETPRGSRAFLESGARPLYLSERALTDGQITVETPDSDGSFTHALSVARVGAFVGNADDDGLPPDSSPAHTGYIDYFFNSASPIVPEDGDRNTLTANWVGNGTVTKDPDKPMYDCDEEVTLTAYPDPGWTFAGWSGDHSGTENPDTVNMTGDRVITATFTQEENRIFLPIITGQYSP